MVPRHCAAGSALATAPAGQSLRLDDGQLRAVQLAHAGRVRNPLPAQVTSYLRAGLQELSKVLTIIWCAQDSYALIACAKNFACGQLTRCWCSHCFVLASIVRRTANLNKSIFVIRSSHRIFNIPLLIYHHPGFARSRFRWYKTALYKKEQKQTNTLKILWKYCNSETILNI